MIDHHGFDELGMADLSLVYNDIEAIDGGHEETASNARRVDNRPLVGEGTFTCDYGVWDRDLI